MRKHLPDVAAATIGVMLAFFVNIIAVDDALYNLRFWARLLDREPIRAEIEEVVREFDRKYVLLYTTGGDLSHLADLPAANMIKRRIVQDINSWRSQGKILSHDRHALNIKKVEIIRPDRAAVVTAENWVLIMRSLATGSRTKEQKHNLVRIRYILQRNQGLWRVIEYEVFGPDDEVPALAEIWKTGV
jgi:hypothetical protein